LKIPERAEPITFQPELEEKAFRLFWQMGFITKPNESWSTTHYRGYVIEPHYHYTNDTTDFTIFKEDAEEGEIFIGTMAEAKESINDNLD
jgi:hypothetical protein